MKIKKLEQFNTFLIKNLLINQLGDQYSYKIDTILDRYLWKHYNEFSFVKFLIGQELGID
jgi:hypothetical protein